MVDEKGLYARALEKFRDDAMPSFRGRYFTSDDVQKFLGLTSKPEHLPYKKALADVLYNLSQVNKKPELEQTGRWYRIIDHTVDKIEWWKGNGCGTKKLYWPYGIQDMTSFGFDESIILYEDDLILISGEGDAGKTALALNILANNLDTHECIYFSSEFNSPKFKDRMMEFSKWVTLFKEDGTPKFDVAKCSDNWQDVIQPGRLNIIDWIYLDDEPWKIRTILGKVIDSLHGGLAVVCMQKRKHKEYAEGGEASKDKASVYLTVTFDKDNMVNMLEVEKAKKPADGYNPKFKKYTFNIANGAELYDIKEVKKVLKNKDGIREYLY